MADLNMNNENEDTALRKQFVIVNIKNEQYGIDISFIDNIVKMQKITRVPKAQSYFKGVINLRGEIIPIMSIRRKFGFEDDEITDNTRIVILKPEQQESIGIIVDLVKEVVTLNADEIEQIFQDNSKEESPRYVYGIGKHDDNLISLLNIHGVIY